MTSRTAPRPPGAGDEMGGAADLGDGVGRAGGQADGAEHRQVGQVVADVADLPRLEPEPADELAKRAGLGVVTLEDVRNRQLGGPPLDGRGVADPRGSPTASPPDARGHSPGRRARGSA